MNKNVRIAKELVKLAKGIVASYRPYHESPQDEAKRKTENGRKNLQRNEGIIKSAMSSVFDNLNNFHFKEEQKGNRLHMYYEAYNGEDEKLIVGFYINNQITSLRFREMKYYFTYLRKGSFFSPDDEEFDAHSWKEGNSLSSIIEIMKKEVAGVKAFCEAQKNDGQ